LLLLLLLLLLLPPPSKPRIYGIIIVSRKPDEPHAKHTH
jgi:hypothetical protein